MTKSIKHPGWTEKDWNETKKTLDKISDMLYNLNKKER